MWKNFITHRGLHVVLLLAFLAGAVVYYLPSPLFVQRLEMMTFDYYNHIFPREPGSDVVIIDIDEESLRLIGQWPWPRTLMAKLVKNLHAAGAKSITFDMVFAEKDRTSPAYVARTLKDTPDMEPVISALQDMPDNETVFAKEVEAAGNVVMGFVLATQQTDMKPIKRAGIMNLGEGRNPYMFLKAFPSFAVTLPELTQAAAGSGSFSVSPEYDGVIRRVPLLIGYMEKDGSVKEMYPSLSLEALRVALGRVAYKVTSYDRRTPKGFGITDVIVGDYKVPTDMYGRMWVHYAGSQHKKYIPAWQVLEDPKSLLLKDKIVLVGTSSIGLFDIRSSPLDASIPGVEVHAEIIEQIQQGRFLHRPPSHDNAEMWAMVGISLFIIFVAPFIGAAMLAFLVTAVIGVAGVGALYAYQLHGLLFAPLYPSLVVITIYIVSSILTNLRTELEKRAVRHAFGHYVSPVLIEELAGDPDKLQLGGEVREISVMFTDIRNFTSISESMHPAALIRMMNDFLTPMTTCVMENRGTVDKYMGDAMMAFWNAPLDDPEHARHACLAALGMLEALERVNENLKTEAEKSGEVYHELKAGIGINTGMASVGNMGSKQRFAYSALGDTVNLASRLEGQTKGYGISVMISEAVRKAVPEFAAIEIDLLTVKGKTEPERVYALLGGGDMADDEAFKSYAAAHDMALTHYRAQEWDDALASIKNCRALRPDMGALYDLYEERIAAFRVAPPPAGWSGVWIAKGK
ncbi:MAG: adenylate/guanylate cyclase domain-containing protein [Alphaproteobacteria bacterium]|nr:adenylate/guanylate cyclase domain-containing protein [Alphaproteobacteria bacterium]